MQIESRKPDWIILASIILASFFIVAGPIARAFYHIEVDYNEGWNAYNAQAATHAALYSPKYSWTTVNYPAVSFYLIGYLSRFLGDPVMIGRLLSLVALLISCVLVALIIKRVTTRWGPAIFGASFCLGLIGATAPVYIAMDDPQMLAHPFFLFGLFLYLGGPVSDAIIFTISALFVLGGNIKHNLIPAPIALFVDLLLVSKAKAVRFVLFSGVFLAASIIISQRVGGAYFVSKILTPRVYSIRQALLATAHAYGYIQIPLIISGAWAIRQLPSKKLRVIAFYFFASLLIGIAFAGGDGVGVNAYFDNFLAISIIMGIVLDSLSEANISLLQRGSPWRSVLPLFLFVGVLFAHLNTGHIIDRRRFDELGSEERQFKQEVDILAAQPGPALCESPLRCFYAGKPFVFDEFNSAQLMKFNKLNKQEMLTQIEQRRFGAIQVYNPPSLPNDFMDAINRYYTASWKSSDCVIYTPGR